MRVLVYPADRHGCGHHRLIWPADELRRAGHDVIVATPERRRVKMALDGDEVVHVEVPDDVDVVVLQRVTHRHLAQAVRVLRNQGIAVVVDVDDDLTAVHPDNPAWQTLHPRNEGHDVNGRPHLHSWRNLNDACRAATLVTVATPALLGTYAAHGRGRVLPNYLAEHYYGHDRVDSTDVTWPAAVHSHPNDPPIVGNAVARLVRDDGITFGAIGGTSGAVAHAFALADHEVHVREPVDLTDWPVALARIGVGIAPLADTRFNAAKSALKPLELSAAGVPWIGSPRAEYQRLHDLGCGVLVDKPRAWYGALRALIRDAGRRAELSEAGRAVADQLRLRDHSWRWWEAWSDAVDLQRGNRDVAA